MILILTGPVQAGKTTFLKTLVPVLRSRGIPISGYLSLPIPGGDRISGYDLFDITTGQSVPFLRRKGRAGWQKVGPYFFLPSGLRAAEDLILGSPSGGWRIVDEIGPQELAGRGVWPALSALVSRSEIDCLLVVRKPLLDQLRGRLGKRPIVVFDIAAKNLRPAFLEKMSLGGAMIRKKSKKGRSES